MKQFFKYIFMLVVVTLGTMTMISCGGDDDSTSRTPQPTYNLTGTWTYSFSSGYCEIIFNADGSGSYMEFDHGKIESSHKFSYTYKDGIISIYYDNGKKEQSSITWQNENTINTNFDENETWVRKVSNINTNTEEKYSIVGTWKCVYEWAYSGIKEEITMEVFKDGRLSFLCKNSNDTKSEVGGGSWEYNANTHKWELSTSNSLVSGSYTIISAQLISYTYFNDGSSRTVIFNKK